MTYLFDLILIAMSIYVLISGIRGKGRLFQIDNLKEGKEEEFLKKARKLYIALGIAMVINSGFSLLLTELYTYDDNYLLTVPLYDLGDWAFLTPGLIKGISYVALAAMIGLLVLLGVFMSKMTDRNAPPKKRENGAPRNGTKAPVSFPTSAFEFDAAEEAEEQNT